MEEEDDEAGDDDEDDDDPSFGQKKKRAKAKAAKARVSDASLISRKKKGESCDSRPLEDSAYPYIYDMLI